MKQKIKSLINPSPEEADDLITTGLNYGYVVDIFGECEVQYDGRATSYLGPGDRNITLKPDGTLLVHAYENHKPRNWQPPGCIHKSEVDRGDTYVKSVRTNPSEIVNIRFSKVYTVQIKDMDDDEELNLWGSEDDLKQRILNDPSLIENGFKVIEEEYKTDAGAVDIFGKDSRGTSTVVELKRSKVGVEAVRQLNGYVSTLERTTDETIRGILVATAITDRAKEYLVDEKLEHVSLAPTAPDTNVERKSVSVRSQQRTLSDVEQSTKAED